MLAPPQDILRGEQMLFHHALENCSPELVCNPQQDGREAEGPEGVGKWKED